MQDILAITAARRGHFLLESGHHGELWLDVDRLFVRPELVRPLASQLADRLRPYDVAAVCGPLTGGAFLAQMVAEELGVAFVYAQRVERQAATGLFPVDYPIPDELAEFVRGQRVGIVNDVINAGSAVRGAIASLNALDVQPVVLGALLVLGDAAAALAAAAGVPLETLGQLSNAVWTPEECPLCRKGEPLATHPDVPS